MAVKPMLSNRAPSACGPGGIFDELESRRCHRVIHGWIACVSPGLYANLSPSIDPAHPAFNCNNSPASRCAQYIALTLIYWDYDQSCAGQTDRKILSICKPTAGCPTRRRRDGGAVAIALPAPHQAARGSGVIRQYVALLDPDKIGLASWPSERAAVKSTATPAPTATPARWVRPTPRPRRAPTLPTRWASGRRWWPATR